MLYPHDTPINSTQPNPILQYPITSHCNIQSPNFSSHPSDFYRQVGQVPRPRRPGNQTSRYGNGVWESGHHGQKPWLRRRILGEDGWRWTHLALVVGVRKMGEREPRAQRLGSIWRLRIWTNSGILMDFEDAETCRVSFYTSERYLPNITGGRG